MISSTGGRAEEWGRKPRPADPTGKTLALTGLNSANWPNNNVFPCLIWAAATVHVHNSQHMQDSKPLLPSQGKIKLYYLMFTLNEAHTNHHWCTAETACCSCAPASFQQQARHSRSSQEASSNRYAASLPPNQHSAPASKDSSCYGADPADNQKIKHITHRISQVSLNLLFQGSNPSNE